MAQFRAFVSIPIDEFSTQASLQMSVKKSRRKTLLSKQCIEYFSKNLSGQLALSADFDPRIIVFVFATEQKHRLTEQIQRGFRTFSCRPHTYLFACAFK